LKSKLVVLALLIGVTVSTVSIYIRHPSTPVLLDNWGFKYSDIVYGVFNPRFEPKLDPRRVSEKWYDAVKYYNLVTGTRVLAYPYVDYMLEYPPVIGAIWALSVNVALLANLPEKYTPHYYIEKYSGIASTHYLANALVNAFFFTLLALYVARAVEMLGVSWKRLLLLAVLPSTYMYLAYNWDVIAAATLTLAVIWFYEEKYFVSGVALGLSIATKILPLLLTPVLLCFLIKKFGWRSAKLFTYACGVAVGLAGFLVQALLNYKSLLDFIEYHASWYCENCLYQLIIPDIFSPLHRAIALASISLTLLFAVLVAWKRKSCNLSELLTLSLFAVIASTALNYVFTPQMMILVTPLAVLTLEKKKLAVYAASDTLNALIIAAFFKDGEIRSFLHSMGLPVQLRGFQPWTIDSPVQWIAIARNILLIYVMVAVLLSLVARGKA